MKVQVLTDAVQTREFPARDGKPSMTFRQQQAAVIRDGDFPKPFKIGLRPDQKPYAPGLYEFTPESIVTDEYERIKFGRDIGLEKIAAAPSPSKA